MALRIGLLLVLLANLWSFSTVAAQEETEPAELALRHRQWLEEDVVYIVSEFERQAFLLLTNDEARDAFMVAFWRERDPTPGTAKNEGLEEHERRIAHANRFLGRGSPRAGWRSDQGRIYIQLGEPGDMQSFRDPRGFWPIDLWFYRTDPRATGLPPFFYVMFFRPQMGGEFRIYDPITDGPGALAKQISLQMASPAEIVSLLKVNVGAEVALASINLIPTERTSFMDPRASAGNAILFAAIEEAPSKGVNLQYASTFVANRGEVDAAVVYSSIPVELSTAAFWDERGMPYLHYGVQVPQERLLIGEYDRDYYLSLAVTVDISDLRGEMIVSGGDEIEQHFDEERAEVIVRVPLAFYDRMELVPGVYDIAVTLRNRVTDETSLARTRVSVPFASGEELMLSDLLVASAVYVLPGSARREGPRAFRFAGEQFVPAVEGRLPQEGTVELFAQIVAPSDLDPGTTLEASAILLEDDGTEVITIYATPVTVAAPPAPTGVRLTLPLEGVRRGSYMVRLTVSLSSGERLTRESSIEVVASDAARRPEILLASEAPAGGNEEYRLRGWQHMRKGELTAAVAYLAAGLERDPDNTGLRRALAQLHMDLEQYADAALMLRPLSVGAGAMAADMLMFSEALREVGAAENAAEMARRVLERGRASPAAYNALAEALIDLGDTEAAIQAFEASLALDSDQPEVRAALARITGESS